MTSERLQLDRSINAPVQPVVLEYRIEYDDDDLRLWIRPLGAIEELDLEFPANVLRDSDFRRGVRVSGISRGNSCSHRMGRIRQADCWCSKNQSGHLAASGFGSGAEAQAPPFRSRRRRGCISWLDGTRWLHRSADRRQASTRTSPTARRGVRPASHIRWRSRHSCADYDGLGASRRRCCKLDHDRGQDIALPRPGRP